MKKWISLFLTALLLPCLFFPAAAESVSPVTDHEDLLTEAEENTLTEKIAQLRETYGIDVMIVTVDSFGTKSAQECADDWYDFSDGGDDGALFLLSMTQREWYISTCGTVIYALTDYGIQQIGEEAVAYIGSGYYFEGFECFLDALPYYLDAYRTGAPVDGYADYSDGYYHGDREETVYYQEEFKPSFLVSLLCGIVVSGVVVLIMRRSMNTKRAQYGAGEYMKEGSWNLTQHQDIFLYSNVTKIRKQEPPKSSGGGSSVHRSSGGRRHGGGGGRF